MKINHIINETTTAGSVATVSTPLGATQTRGNSSIYGGKKVGNLLKGKKTSKPFANSLNEAAMKDLAYDLQNMKPAEFFKKYGKTREEMKAAMNKQPAQAPVNEADLQEDDVILIPGQGRKSKTGFVPHGKSRVDHEVEMARSDLFSAAKNAQQVYAMIKEVSEDEGLEGWVQEKIIKANDYLNTIREYLEGKQVQGVTENNQRGDSLVTDSLKIMKGGEVSDAVRALTTVLGNREYNSRRGFYNFYIKQMIDMYGQQGVAEGVADMHSDELLNTVRDAGAAGIGAASNSQARASAKWLETVEQAKELLAKGFTPDQIAKKLGVTGPNNGMAGPMNGDWGAINYAVQQVRQVRRTGMQEGSKSSNKNKKA